MNSSSWYSAADNSITACRSMLEARKSMLYPTLSYRQPTPSRYARRWAWESVNRNPRLRQHPSRRLALDSQVVTRLPRKPNLLDNNFLVCCVQYYGEQKSQGTPAYWTVIAPAQRNSAATHWN